MANKTPVMVVSGDKALLKALKKAGEAGQKALRPAIVDGASVMANAVRGRAKNDWVRANVETKVVFDDAKGVTVLVGVKSDKDHPSNIPVWLEYGVAPHKIPAKYSNDVVLNILGRLVRGQVKHPGIAAQPFMRPAFDESKDAALAAIENALRRELNL